MSGARKKSYKNRFIVSIITLLLTVSCFITVSYAWFTNSAYVSGNKVFVGNLMVDVLISKDDLKANLVNSGVTPEWEDMPSYLNDFKYTRTLTDGTTETYYYASRIPSTVNSEEIDTSILHVENVEPGQAIRVKVNIVNSGDLALKAAGALRIEESFTGLETLINKNISESMSFDEDGIPDSFNPDSGLIDESNKSGYASIDQETFLFNTLLNIQTKIIDNEEETDIIIGDKKFKDVGGHLEDTLCVYLLEGVGDGDIQVDREALNNELEDLEQDDRFFGTLMQFEFLTTYGQQASKDNNTTKDIRLIMDVCNYKNENILPTEVPNIEIFKTYSLDEYKSLVQSTSLTVNEEYMGLYGKYEANLYNDYQRYLAYASGYCLPLGEMQDPDNDDKIDKYGKTVDIKDIDGNLLYTKEGVSEIETINFLLYMPLEAGNEYQNASISLSLGATATQVEYEADGTGYVLYDQSTPRNMSHEYTIITYKVKGEICTLKLPLLLKKGTVINFEAGENVEYDPVPDSITLSEDTIALDLTNDKYAPTVNGGQTHYVFRFDSNTNTIIAKGITMPEKSDLITIGDKNYRVLDVDGVYAKVLAMYDAKKDYLNFGVSTTKFSDDKYGLKYLHSQTDDYLEYKFYPLLEFKDAIIPQDIDQSMFKRISNFPEYIDEYNTGWSKNNFDASATIDDVGSKTYYIAGGYGSANVGLRHVYLLDLKDVLEYLGDNISPQSVNKMFFNVDCSIDSSFTPYYNCYLRSAGANDSKDFWYVRGECGDLSDSSFAQTQLGIRPAFVVDLTKVDYVKVISN